MGNCPQNLDGDMLPSHSRILAEAINKTIFSSNTVATFMMFNDCFVIHIFIQNSFQSISVIFCFLVPDILKIAFSTMDLLYNRIVLYNRIILYNRTISSLVLFIFTGVIFGVFDIIYFRLALKALDIEQFLWWMCYKNEIQTKVLS